MAISPLPAPLQQLGGRRFSFYPPIRNIAHNEWIYRRASWTEVVVVNTGSGAECVIPRAHIGDVSYVDAPVVIVGLKRELESREGIVRAWHQPVIELPVAVNQSATVVPHPERLAPVVSIRLEPRSESRSSHKLAVGLMLGAIGCLIAANIARTHLAAPAATEHSVRTLDGNVYRLIRYADRRSIVVLDAESRYLGTIDPHGRVLSAVTLPDGRNSAPLLRSLPPF
jgi:hypothetical protein